MTKNYDIPRTSQSYTLEEADAAIDDLRARHYDALKALRRLDKALCIYEDTKDEWQYQMRRIEKTEQQMKDEHKAWADFREAEEELLIARWASCDLLTVEGF